MNKQETWQKLSEIVTLDPKSAFMLGWDSALTQRDKLEEQYEPYPKCYLCKYDIIQNPNGSWAHKGISPFGHKAMPTPSKAVENLCATCNRPIYRIDRDSSWLHVYSGYESSTKPTQHWATKAN